MKRVHTPKKSKTSDLMGFDLSEDHLKLVHVRLGVGKREVSHVASREVQGLSEDDIVAFVRETASKFGVPGAPVYITVPLSTVITRSIEIPSRDPDEIREIVNLQASRHTPYARSEIITDLLPLGIIKENYTKVLLVIAPREIIVRHTRITEKAGLRLEKVFFPSEGMAQACQMIMGGEAKDTTMAIVHMDTAITNFMIAQRSNLLFVRSIPIGAFHLLEEKEVYRDRFVDELNKSIESYTADEAGPGPSVLILTGVVAEITDLDYLFSGTLSIPIRHQTYFNYFAISDEAKAAASASKNVSFFNVIAPLLLYDKMHVDLVTEERKLKFEIERKGRQIVRTAILVMMVLFLGFGLLASKVYFRTAYLKGITARYQPFRDEAKELEKVFEKTQAVRGYLLKRGKSLEVMAGLYDALPPDVRLSSIRYEDGERFSIKGTSTTMSSVFTLITNLEKSKSKLFTNVKTKYVTSRTEGGVDLADFEIVSDILLEKAAS